MTFRHQITAEDKRWLIPLLTRHARPEGRLAASLWGIAGQAARDPVVEAELGVKFICGPEPGAALVALEFATGSELSLFLLKHATTQD